MKTIILIALIALIVWLVKRNKKPEAAAPAPAAQAVAKPENTENIKVAGISFRTDAVLSLAEENDAFNYTMKDIKAKHLEEECIYKYKFKDHPADFVFEPENEYDPNAIAIYVEGQKIGYVKKGSTSHIRNLINSGRLESAICHISGGPFKQYMPDIGITTEADNEFSAKITLALKNENPES